MPFMVKGKGKNMPKSYLYIFLSGNSSNHYYEWRLNTFLFALKIRFFASAFLWLK